MENTSLKSNNLVKMKCSGRHKHQRVNVSQFFRYIGNVETNRENQTKQNKPKRMESIVNKPINNNNVQPNNDSEWMIFWILRMVYLDEKSVVFSIVIWNWIKHYTWNMFISWFSWYILTFYMYKKKEYFRRHSQKCQTILSACHFGAQVVAISLGDGHD